MKNNPLDDFVFEGLAASFHYADESTKEWTMGKRREENARKIFEAHPELHAEMREAAKKFLWRLDKC